MFTILQEKKGIITKKKKEFSLLVLRMKKENQLRGHVWHKSGQTEILKQSGANLHTGTPLPSLAGFQTSKQ